MTRSFKAGKVIAQKLFGLRFGDLHAGLHMWAGRTVANRPDLRRAEICLEPQTLETLDERKAVVTECDHWRCSG